MHIYIYIYVSRFMAEGHVPAVRLEHLSCQVEDISLIFLSEGEHLSSAVQAA